MWSLDREMSMGEGAHKVHGVEDNKPADGISELGLGREPITPTEATQTQPIDVITEPAEQGDKKEAQSHRKIGRRTILTAGIASGATLALIGGGLGIYVLGANSNRSKASGAPDESDKDRQNSISSPVATQSPIQTPEATQPTPEAVPTSATDKDGINQVSPVVPEIAALQDPTVTAQNVIDDALIYWRAAGTGPSLVADQQKSGLDPETYAEQTAAKNTEDYTSKLFVENWQAYPDLKAYADEIEALNRKNIYLKIMTAKEEYQFLWVTNLKPENITIESSGTERIDAHMIFTDLNNGTQPFVTKYDDTLADPTLGEKRINVKLVREGDDMKISALTKFNVK